MQPVQSQNKLLCSERYEENSELSEHARKENIKEAMTDIADLVSSRGFQRLVDYCHFQDEELLKAINTLNDVDVNERFGKAVAGMVNFQKGRWEIINYIKETYAEYMAAKEEKDDAI